MVEEDYYDRTDPNNTPMMRRMRHPTTPHPRHVIDKKHKISKRHEFSLFEGFSDDAGNAVLNDDYYGYLLSLGYYKNDKYPKQGPWTHDLNTTTALHFTDTSKQKTPIDKRMDVVNQNLGEVAANFNSGNLYDVQDFSDVSAKRIKEKTYRILSDHDRKLQSQKLIDMQKVKGDLTDPIHSKNIHPLNKLIAYNSMLLDVNIMLLNRMTDVLDYQEKIHMFNKYETKPLGQNFYAEITLKAGDEAMKLDFTDSANNRNVPASALLYDFPKHNLLSLQIIFDSGTDLYFSTNKPTNSLETYMRLKTPPQQYTMTPGQFSIKSVNLRASGSDASVRLLGLY
jgi:hypothetical protein